MFVLPPAIDNRYRGQTIALWIFGLLVLLNALEARQRSNRFTGGNPMTRLATLLFASLLTFAAAGAQPNDAQALYRSGRDAIRRGDPEAAAQYFEKAVELRPNVADYHYQLGGAYGQAAATAGMLSRMGLAKKARAGWERAVELDPNFIPARFALLEFHVMVPAMLGGDEAVALLQASEIRRRDAIEGHRAFARIHTASNKPELARREYAVMLQAAPASAKARYHFGVYLMLTEKDYKAATDQFEAALKLDASYMPAHFQIGHVAALAANGFARGESSLKKYLGYEPKDEEPSLARTHYWLGALYEKQNRRAEAKAQYAASLRLRPGQKDVAEAMRRVS